MIKATMENIDKSADETVTRESIIGQDPSENESGFRRPKKN